VDAVSNWHYTVALDNHGVGISLKGLVAIEWTPRRQDVDAVIRAIGPCLVRTVKDDEAQRRVYLFRAERGWRDEDIQTHHAGLGVRRSGLIVLSGSDEAGREYVWDRDTLQAHTAELATFEHYDTARLLSALEQLPAPDYSKGRAPKREKAAA
jgi:hypothetical protein